MRIPDFWFDLLRDEANKESRPDVKAALLLAVERLKDVRANVR